MDLNGLLNTVYIFQVCFARYGKSQKAVHYYLLQARLNGPNQVKLILFTPIIIIQLFSTFIHK